MHTNYIIPVNFTDAGKLLGTFPVRNSIEALCLLVGAIGAVRGTNRIIPCCAAWTS